MLDGPEVGNTHWFSAEQLYVPELQPAAGTVAAGTKRPPAVGQDAADAKKSKHQQECDEAMKLYGELD